MADKRVLVTGSARGIGAAVAQRLAKDGWKVAIHYVHSRHNAESLVSKIGASASGAYQADLGDLRQVKGLIDRVVADGPLHALVNNAGVYLTMDFTGSSDDQFAASISRCMAINFEAPAWLTRAACKHFLTHGGGKVVNVPLGLGIKERRGRPGIQLRKQH